MQKGRIRQPTHSQQTHYKTFSNCARGSDPWRGWNAAECKCALEALLAGVSTKRAAEQHMHLNRNKTQEIHYNSLKHFPLQGFSKHLLWFRCSGKGEHLNHAKRQNPAAKPLTATHCKTFSDCTRGSDPWQGWNAAEFKCTLEALLAGVSTKRAAEQHRHLNRNKTRKIHYNSLKHFPLQGFSKHLLWFRCSGKGEHLNHAERQNPAVNPLTANALQDFQQLRPWFRCNSKWKHQKNRYTNAKRQNLALRNPDSI